MNVQFKIMFLSSGDIFLKRGSYMISLSLPWIYFCVEILKLLVLDPLLYKKIANNRAVYRFNPFFIQQSTMISPPPPPQFCL
jgi:hypothetical protein